MRLGAHQSIAGGYENAVRDAEADGCEALQIFTKVSNQWRESVATPEKAAPFIAGVERLRLGPVLSHVSYLVNLCSDKPDVREKSVAGLAAELRRCDTLHIACVVLHPGAHLGQGEEAGTQRVCEGLDAAFDLADRDGRVAPRILLENTAGQGSNLGATFENLAAFFRGARCTERLGLCFDTCHALAAGYDWTTEAGYREVFDRLDATVGLKRVRAFHLNDSKKGAGSRVDRHARIGDGLIGLDPFRRLIRDPRFADHPGVLEIPPRDDGDRGYHEQLEALRRLRDAPADHRRGA